MSGPVAAATVDGTAPTPTAPLPHVNAHAARRQTTEIATTSPTTVGSLEQAVQRTETGIGRIEIGVGELRKRVPPLAGRLDARRPTRRTAAS